MSSSMWDVKSPEEIQGAIQALKREALSRPIVLEDGKYTVLRDDGCLRALRNGEPWRDLTGEKLVGALCDRIDELTAPDPVPKRPPVRLTIRDAGRADENCDDCTWYYLDAATAPCNTCVHGAAQTNNFDRR